MKPEKERLAGGKKSNEKETNMERTNAEKASLRKLTVKRRDQDEVTSSFFLVLLSSLSACPLEFVW